MRRILLKLSVSVLTFALGLTVSALWRFYTNPPLAGISAVMPSPLLSVDTVVIGCGSKITASSYVLSNGAEITRTCQHFSSDAEARNVLETRRGGGGYDLVEWSSRVDADGERIGESVLLFSSQSVVRINRDGSTLCETHAPTLGNLRWFENDKY